MAASNPRSNNSISGGAAAGKAMQIELVLGLVAKNLPTGDLLAIRPTCKLWNRLLILQLKSKHDPIQLNPPPTARFHDPDPTGRRTERFQNFTIAMQSSLDIPFAKYDVNVTNFGPGASSGVEDFFQNFFGLCGPTMTHINLTYNRDSDWGFELEEDKIRRIIFELTPNLADLVLNGGSNPFTTQQPSQAIATTREIPKLRRFTFKMLEFGPTHFGKWSKLLSDVLRAAVGLESLTLEGRHNCKDEVIRIVRDNLANPHKIKSLHLLGSGVVPYELRILAEIGRRQQHPLRLTEFIASLQSMDWQNDQLEQSNNLRTFLDTQRETLRALYITPLSADDDDIVGPEPEPLRIPKLENLHTFGLTRIRDFCAIKYEGGTAVGNNFPSLKKLIYKRHRYSYEWAEAYLDKDETWLDDHTQLISPGVTDLALEIKSFPLLSQLTQFVANFSSITRLDLKFQSKLHQFEELAFLWTTWPALASLHIQYRQNSRDPLDLDEDLTGIPSSRFKLLREVIAKVKVKGSSMTLEVIQELLNKFKTNPGISDLKHLKNFVLNVNVEQVGVGQFQFSDIGGYFGLAMANPSMQHLEVKVNLNQPRGVVPNLQNMISVHCQQVVKDAFSPFAVIEPFVFNNLIKCH